GCPRPGEWTTFGLDLTGSNYHGLAVDGKVPDAALRQWTDFSRQRVRQIGLYVFSSHKNWAPKGSALPLTARFDNIRAVRFDAPEPHRAISVFEIPDAVLKAAGTSAEVYTDGVESAQYHVGDLWQCHFKINKTFANPYDPRECDAAAIVTAPSGKRVRVPAFFNQVCRRREAAAGGEELVDALGEEFFTVRYRVTEPGAHKVQLELREGGRYDTRLERSEMVSWVPGRVTAALDLDAPAFTAKKGDKPFRGFVRVAANKRNFEWDDGTFFYPIGPNLRSPSDNRIPYADAKWNADFLNRLNKRGTYQYDEYFAEYQKAGINWARLWMCSWWVSLEWRRDWPHYQGVGRYNLQNAWRLDYLLEQAEKKDITLMLCLTNHGQFSTEVDEEWQNNPLNSKLGGPLKGPREFFSSAEAKIWHQNKLRYIAARYGHSPAIMAWSLFSEVEWVDENKPSLVWGGIDRPAPNIESWHVEMAKFLKQIDPNHHLISTHFSHPVRGEATLALAEIEIPSSNAYSAFDYFKLGDNICDAASTLSDYWQGNKKGVKGFKIFNKPVMVEEQGRHWMGAEGGKVHNTKQQLDADLHAGLWGSMVQPLCGATGYWWWLHLHYDKRYDSYRALSNFMKDEDFRPGAGETQFEPVARTIKGEGQDLMGRAMKSNQRLYAWIYHPQMPLGNATPDVTGGKLKVGGLNAGKYSVEFWDTYKGVVSESREVDIQANTSLELPLPVVKADLAVKVKPKRGR
ncbi:MAG TPA: hypothetical protein VEJ63_17160, partial [Planctomycetota bacterium]|nr:hypothetical protein [Planctomycetota bacterium]